MTWGDAVAFAAKGVCRRPGRAVLTVLAVALAAALLTALLTIAGTAETRVLDQLAKGGPLAGIKVAAAAPDPAQIDQDNARPGDPRDLDDIALRRIAALPDVRQVLAVVTAQMLVIAPTETASGESLEPFAETMVGVDLSSAAALPVSVLAGRLPEATSQTEVAVTQGYLERLGLERTEADQVLGTEIEMGAGRLYPHGDRRYVRGRWTRVRVVGVVAQEAAPGSLLVPLEQAQAARRWTAAGPGGGEALELSTSPYSGLFVVAAGIDNVSRVWGQITAIGYSTSAPENLIATVRRYLRVVEIVLAAVGVIALVIAALGITNALLAAVRERHREIGVLKAIGARDRDILSGLGPGAVTASARRRSGWRGARAPPPVEPEPPWRPPGAWARYPLPMVPWPTDRCRGPRSRASPTPPRPIPPPRLACWQALLATTCASCGRTARTPRPEPRTPPSGPLACTVSGAGAPGGVSTARGTSRCATPPRPVRRSKRRWPRCERRGSTRLAWPTSPNHRGLRRRCAERAGATGDGGSGRRAGRVRPPLMVTRPAMRAMRAALATTSRRAPALGWAKRSRRPDTKVIVLIDYEVLRRGHAEAEEVCEIAGVGPIPVATATSMMADACGAAVVTNGVDVFSVAHLGRSVSAHQRSALEARGYRCEVPGCGATRALEIDHLDDWRHSFQSHLARLAWLYRAHHLDKTHRGWRLEGPAGDRRWRAPGARSAVPIRHPALSSPTAPATTPPPRERLASSATPRQPEPQRPASATGQRTGDGRAGGADGRSRGPSGPTVQSGVAAEQALRRRL